MTSRCLGPTVQESWKSIVWLDSARKGLRRPKRPGADSRYCLGNVVGIKHENAMKNNLSTHTVHRKLRCVALYHLRLFPQAFHFWQDQKCRPATSDLSSCGEHPHGLLLMMYKEPSTSAFEVALWQKISETIRQHSSTLTQHSSVLCPLDWLWIL